MAIRPASAKDIDAVMALVRQMHAEGFFRHVELDEAKVRAVFEHCAGGAGFFVVGEGQEGIDGFLIGRVSELWYSRARVASDLALFVRPNRRGGMAAVRMVQAFVAWAKEQGAAEVCISQSSGVRVEETNRLLTGMGFSHLGGVYKWRFDVHGS